MTRRQMHLIAFDGCFFADLFGLYDIHEGSCDAYVRRGGADRLQDVFKSGACGGFVVSPVNHPGMFGQFCRSVVPELQRRSLFRRDYAGRMLR